MLTSESGGERRMGAIEETGCVQYQLGKQSAFKPVFGANISVTATGLGPRYLDSLTRRQIECGEHWNHGAYKVSRVSRGIEL